MKTSLVVMMVALLFSCSDYQQLEGFTDMGNAGTVNRNLQAHAEVDSLMDRARWGDGQAYLQLADCYKDGAGVQKDFLGMMCMAMQARAYGAIKEENDYFLRLSDENNFKRYFNLVNKSSRELREGKDSIKAQLAEMDDPDALALYGIVSIEGGDTAEGFETIRKAADYGSNLAVILNTFSSRKGAICPDRYKLELVAERIPVAYKILGRLCLAPDENGNIDEGLAASYYLKAEEHALLSRREARWLVGYYREGGDIRLNEEDVRRLEMLACFPGEEKDVIVADTVDLDSVMVDGQ